MVKKLQKMAEKKTASAANLLDSQLAHSVKESAQQIWLAGMGAFAKAQAEGGKVFEALVKEGVSLQKKTQGLAEERISAVTGKMTAMADGMSHKAGAQWDKLESIFEERVAKTLNKMGVPSSKDIDALIERIDGLSAKVRDKAPPAKTAARKPAAKAPAKRVVRKGP
ncbi:MAG: phasin family protein [Burkholderiaceae bacterium]|nr:phasin family protein [Burkholderiaceae bacterium]